MNLRITCEYRVYAYVNYDEPYLYLAYDFSDVSFLDSFEQRHVSRKDTLQVIYFLLHENAETHQD